MVLCKWNDLPEHMRCDEVKEYYDILNSRKGSLIAKRIFDFRHFAADDYHSLANTLDFDYTDKNR